MKHIGAMQTSAQIIDFPGACMQPVIQTRTSGRLPNAVTSMRLAKSKRKDAARIDQLISSKLQELESVCLSMKKAVAQFTEEIERIKEEAATANTRDLLISELENERINREKTRVEIAVHNEFDRKAHNAYAAQSGATRG